MLELKNIFLHERAHAWDGYYGFKTGESISVQSDFVDYSNKYNSHWKSAYRANSRKVEIFVATVTNYYWPYKSSDGKNKGYYQKVYQNN